MANSKTAIVNLALSRVGEPAIESIDDTGSEVARKVRTVYEHCVKTLSRMTQWQCLKKRVQLTQNATAPAFGYSYSYNLPEDFVRMISVNDIDAWDQEDWYELEQGKLLIDQDEAKIVYVAYTEDTTKFDPLFTEALSVLLASRLATIIRQDENLAIALYQEYKQSALPDAIVADGNEQYHRPKKPTDTSEWIQSRRYVTGVPSSW